MKHHTYFWKTNDKKKLFAQCWKPEDEANRTVLLIHGLNDHTSRYTHMAEFFTTRGFNFLAFDLRGHGRSSGKRAHASSVKQLLEDVDLAYQKLKELFPKSKLVLYGHDIGGTLALNYVIQHNKPVDALIVSSPLLKMPLDPSSPTFILSYWLKKITPGLRMNSSMKFSPDQLSHDPMIIKNVEKDPLINNKPSLGLFFELCHAGQYALRNVYKINYPFLLMHGDADAITSAKVSEQYVMNTSDRTRLKIWEGQYHELHNELIREEVFNYTLDWLKEHGI